MLSECSPHSSSSRSSQKWSYQRRGSFILDVSREPPHSLFQYHHDRARDGVLADNNSARTERSITFLTNEYIYCLDVISGFRRLARRVFHRCIADYHPSGDWCDGAVLSDLLGPRFGSQAVGACAACIKTGNYSNWSSKNHKRRDKRAG